MRFVSLTLFCAVCGLLAVNTASSQVGINSSGNPPAEGAMLDVSSTTMGFLPPRMSMDQRNAIPNPPEGLTIYNTDSRCLEVFRGEPLGWYSTCPGVPIVTTSAVTAIGVNSAQTGGFVAADGGATVISRGVCWGTSPEPTLDNDFTVNGLGIGAFTTSITSLQMGTTYYVRAYATNSVGTAYGDEQVFTTIALPSVITSGVSSIETTTAAGGGNVTNDGGAAVTARGVCWGTSPLPTLADAFITSGSGIGSFSSELSALTPGTTYYTRAWATNIAGTAYGDDVSFTTNGLLYFTSPGVHYWTVPEGVTSLAVTVVGGGGGGGGDVGGGGGGGRVINSPSYAVSPGQQLTIEVAAQTDYPQSYAHFGRDGFQSSLTGGTGGTLTAMGGNGGRGRSNGGGAGANVGWNGGGGSYDYNGGNAGQGGFAGGNAYPGRSAGGGGGSGGVGSSATVNAGGDGGPGVMSIIDGNYYGGGGGGGEYQGNSGGQGTHGGGTGGRQGNNPPGTDAQPNTGSGGGGGGSTANFPNSGRGASGVVIIAYQIQN